MQQAPDIETLKRDAAKGIVGAQYNLGVWLLSAAKEHRDPVQAREYFERAAEQGFAAAQSALGYLLLRGQGVEVDLERAAEYFADSACDGFAEAQYRLAELHATGCGCKQDSVLASEWLRRSADQQHPLAMSQLAYCTSHGLGCDVDPLAATALYARAASAGEPRAQCAIAWRYTSGHTLEKSAGRAKAWYARAAGLGYPGAKLFLPRFDEVAAIDSSEIAPLDTGQPGPLCRGEALSWSPRVFCFHDFLSQEECFHLMALSAPFLRPSMVIQRATGKALQSGGRRSGGMSFVDPLRDMVVWNVEQRIARYTMLPAENAEPLSILHYGVGDEYRPHRDYFHPSFPGSEQALRRGGQRVATFMIYLNDVDRGGATGFPEAGLAIEPRAGMGGLLFNVCPDGSPDPLTLHAGMPVEAGEKWLATRWIREHTYRPTS